MERIQELEEAIREYWTARTSIKRGFLNENYDKFKSEFSKVLIDLVDEQNKRRSEGSEEKILAVYMYRLMTSVYTEGYEVILGIANSDLYLDENKSEKYWFPELIYKNIDEDMKEVENRLRKKFLRLETYELFRLKIILLEDDWKLLQEFFLRLVKDLMGVIIESPLRLNGELQILSGNYMDKPESLWSTTTEGSVRE